MTEDRPALPAWATERHRERYAEIAALARRAADRLPHASDKFAEPGHGFDAHVRPSPALGEPPPSPLVS